jgi:hypothetical protein
MNITELNLNASNSGAKYKTEDEIWSVYQGSLMGETGDFLNELYTLEEIIKMDFIEIPALDCTNWENETPILVRDRKKDKWERAYFCPTPPSAMYQVYAYSGGGTEWSSNGHIRPWTFAKLADQE